MVDPRGRRATAATLAVVVVAVDALLAACTHGTASHGGATAHPTATMHVKAAQPSLPAAESGLLPWHMAGPLSREVVTAGSPGQLIVLGGLSASDTSTNGVYAVSTATGAVRRIGALPVAVHDAAVAVSGQRALVFGGGSAASVSTVQSFPLARGGAVTDVGNLPAPRSDAQAATIGATTYIVGGFDGSKPDASVVATTMARPTEPSPRCRFRCIRGVAALGGASTCSAARPSPGRTPDAGQRHPGRRPGPAHRVDRRQPARGTSGRRGGHRRRGTVRRRR